MNYTQCHLPCILQHVIYLKVTLCLIHMSLILFKKTSSIDDRDSFAHLPKLCIFGMKISDFNLFSYHPVTLHFHFFGKFSCMSGAYYF